MITLFETLVLTAMHTSHYGENGPRELPNGWVWTAIGEIAKYNIGLTYYRADIVAAGVPVLRSIILLGFLHIFLRNIISTEHLLESVPSLKD